MAISNLLTGRVRVVSPKNVTSDRYEFLDVSQAEPNFGVPSFSASLYDNPAILVSDSEGNRGFIQFAPTAKQIGSGSATASISPNLGLQVNVNTTIAGNLYVKDSIFAEQLVVSYISSSVIYSSGSNKFGDDILDVQQITGSLNISGSVRITGSLKAQEITGSVSGAFTGDGAGLFNIPRSAFSGDSFRIASGSVTASVNPQYGFRVESALSGSEFTGSVEISGSISASLFIGDGRGLFNLPALTATLIASGSATASIAPNTGLVVNTFSTFQFPVSASMFSGSGKGLFDIPRSAITEDSVRISSGSVTASVSPNFGFVVQSKLVGSQFTGSLFVTGNIELGVGGVYSGSGRNLFDIPRSALTPDALVATLIGSASVTASTSPDFGFRVISAQSGSSFTGSLFVSGGIEINSGSSYSGSGARLFDIPVKALKDLDLDSGSARSTCSHHLGRL